MSKEDWKCCDCPKYKAHQHEGLISFSDTYGNNRFKIEDARQGNQRCKEHFDKAEVAFEEMLNLKVVRSDS